MMIRPTDRPNPTSGHLTALSAFATPHRSAARRHHPRTRILVAGAGLAIGLLLLAPGCGNGDNGADNETGSATGETPRFGPGAGAAGGGSTSAAPGPGEAERIASAPPPGFAGPVAPPSPGPGVGDGMMGMGQGDAPMNEEASGLVWTLPAGWEEAPNTSSMRLATIMIDPSPGDDAGGDEPGSASQPRIEMSVTSLRGAAGGLLPNVNRWRQQLGLPMIAQIGEQSIAVVNTADGIEGQLVSMAQPGESNDRTAMLVGIVQHAGDSYFFKMTGPAGAVLEQDDEMQAFLGSLRFEQ